VSALIQNEVQKLAKKPNIVNTSKSLFYISVLFKSMVHVDFNFAFIA
jgi:hypothetical protein